MKKFFFIELKPLAFQVLDNIPTYTSVPFPSVLKYDCTEYTLHFLGILTSQEAAEKSAHQECVQSGITSLERNNLLKKQFPNYVFLEYIVSYKFLLDNLPPNTATFGVVMSKSVDAKLSHAVIFAKDEQNNLYLVDRQQNVKFINDDIQKYLDFGNFDNTKCGVYFADDDESYQLLGSKRKIPDRPILKKVNDENVSKLQRVYGGKKSIRKNKSRKHKSRKHKSRNHKSRKH